MTNADDAILMDVTNSKKKTTDTTGQQAINRPKAGPASTKAGPASAKAAAARAAAAKTSEKDRLKPSTSKECENNDVSSLKKSSAAAAATDQLPNTAEECHRRIKELTKAMTEFDFFKKFYPIRKKELEEEKDKNYNLRGELDKLNEERKSAKAEHDKEFAALQDEIDQLKAAQERDKKTIERCYADSREAAKAKDEITHLKERMKVLMDENARLKIEREEEATKLKNHDEYKQAYEKKSEELHRVNFLNEQLEAKNASLESDLNKAERKLAKEDERVLERAKECNKNEMEALHSEIRRYKREREGLIRESDNTKMKNIELMKYQNMYKEKSAEYAKKCRDNQRMASVIKRLQQVNKERQLRDLQESQDQSNDQDGPEQQHDQTNNINDTSDLDRALERASRLSNNVDGDVIDYEDDFTPVEDDASDSRSSFDPMEVNGLSDDSDDADYQAGGTPAAAKTSPSKKTSPDAVKTPQLPKPATARKTGSMMMACRRASGMSVKAMRSRLSGGGGDGPTPKRSRTSSSSPRGSASRLNTSAPAASSSSLTGTAAVVQDILETSRGDLRDVEELEEPPPPCVICRQGVLRKNDPILVCCACKVSVHHSCLDDNKAPKTTPDTWTWRCAPCADALDTSTLPCVFCPTRGGLYAPLNNPFERYDKRVFRWGHLICGKMIHGLTIVSGKICETERVHAARWEEPCSICFSVEGAICRCHEYSKSGCKVDFHATCVMRDDKVGLVLDTILCATVPRLSAYCFTHKPSLVALKKKEKQKVVLVNQGARLACKPAKGRR